MDIEKLRSDYQEMKKQYKSLLLGEFRNRLEKTYSKSIESKIRPIWLNTLYGHRYVTGIAIAENDNLTYEWHFDNDTEHLSSLTRLDIDNLFELYEQLFNKK